MGRLGVTQNQVFQAAGLLTADGVRPTVDTVRVALGNTGSRTTINTYLKSWREQQTSRDGTGAMLSGQLRQLITEQAELLLKAVEAESRANGLDKTKELEAALSTKHERNQQLENLLSECRAQLASLQETSKQKKLPQLRQHAELTDLRDQNQMYREALGKEIARRETLEHQLAVFQQALKGTPPPHDKSVDSHDRIAAELQALQQRDRDQRVLLKKNTNEIKQLNLQLRMAHTQHDQDLERLSRSLTELAQLIK